MGAISEEQVTVIEERRRLLEKHSEGQLKLESFVCIHPAQ